MKKYFLIIFGCLAFLHQNIFCQRVNNEECKTPSSPTDFLKEIPQENYKVLAGTRVIKTFIVIYADDNGFNRAITEETLKTELAFSNSVYSMGSICLSIVGIEFRNNTVLNNPQSSASYNSEQVDGAFTVFVVNSIDGKTGSSGTFGWAPSIPATYMVTRTAGFGTRRTFIHEMGHALGLHHTFKGTGHDDDNPGCDELVNGGNGISCGDFVADTPADPYERCGTASLSGCTFPYTAPDCKDANGSSYSPQMNNFMSYWPNYGCDRTVFTSGQYTRMQNTIDNNITLITYLAPASLDLTNSTYSSGFVKQAAMSVMNIGNINSAGNYTVSATVQATFTSAAVNLKPGFTAAPTGAGVVRILAANCQ